MMSTPMRTRYALDGLIGICWGSGRHGSEVERRAKAVIKSVGGLSILSEELRARSVGWPSLCRLSALRASTCDRLKAISSALCWRLELAVAQSPAIGVSAVETRWYWKAPHIEPLLNDRGPAKRPNAIPAAAYMASRHSNETFGATPFELINPIMNAIGWPMTQEVGYIELESGIQSEPSKFDELLGWVMAGSLVHDELTSDGETEREATHRTRSKDHIA